MVHSTLPRHAASPRRFALPAILAFAVLSSPTLAQDRTDFQQWTLITLNAKLPKRFLGYLEFQPRIANDVQETGRILIRPAIGYQLNRKISAWIGYGWTPSFTPKYNDEHRIFQQLFIDDKVKKLTVQNRTRLEQRFIAGAGDTSVRLRHMLRVAHPLEASGRWYAASFNEIFFNLNSTPNGPTSGFDQNRFYIGLGRTLAPGLKGELGYMLNTVSPPRGASDTINHVLFATLNYSL